mmetsp:Transcript_148168/g.369416  ORF Transcript_148168/g.369416 Transcript_148168/m.369416 type:complete len:218 (-) Transcript_148168:844-1497(-)
MDPATSSDASPALSAAPPRGASFSLRLQPSASAPRREPTACKPLLARPLLVAADPWPCSLLQPGGRLLARRQQFATREPRLQRQTVPLPVTSRPMPQALAGPKSRGGQSRPQAVWTSRRARTDHKSRGTLASSQSSPALMPLPCQAVPLSGSLQLGLLSPPHVMRTQLSVAVPAHRKQQSRSCCRRCLRFHFCHRCGSNALGRALSLHSPTRLTVDR